MSPDDINRFFARLAAQNPEPRSELNYVNEYTLLVAVVLSAQATDVGVNRATQHLFSSVRTPAEMLIFGEVKLRESIKTIGLFNIKAKNIIKLSEILVRDHRGVVPEDRDALEALPGVGRKTANVVLNIAFGQPTIAVDTHIFRVANRTGMAPGATPTAVEARLEMVVPDHWKQHAHHWLILHGRYLCKAKSPSCSTCFVSDLCNFSEKTTLI